MCVCKLRRCIALRGLLCFASHRKDAAAMAGGGHGASAHNITHGGLSLHATKGWHSRVGQGMCAVMWFWVLYRAKQDGPALMGWRHPWESHGHGGHDDHEEAKHH